MQRDTRRADSPQVWLDHARADLALAGAPLPSGARLEQLCFHAQQAAEKSLKAVLIHFGVEFPYTHNLQALLDRVPETITKPEAADDIVSLTPYAVSTRYPAEMEAVEEKEHEEAVQAAQAALKWAECIVGQKLTSD